MVVLSQPGQAGDREAVVVLVNGEGMARSTSRSTLDATVCCWDSPVVI